MTDELAVLARPRASGPADAAPRPSALVALRSAARVALAASAAASFFVCGPIFGLVFLPVLRLLSRGADDYRRRCTRLLGRGHAFFAWSLRAAGLLHGPATFPAPPGVAPGQPYVLVSNHPTLIDAIFLLGGYRDLTCVVNRRWYGSLAFGSLLRQSAYLPGPRRHGAEADDDVLSAMVAHLRRGHPLLVFPEGERSPPAGLRRFRRGGVEAAVRARVPIVAVFLSTDRPFLTKTVSMWGVARRPVRYRLELLEVIDTRAIPEEGARALNAELQAKYRAHLAASGLVPSDIHGADPEGPGRGGAP